MDSTEDYLAKRKRNPKQVEFFDERADCWDEVCVHDPVKIDHIVSLLDLGDGCDILDVGTGTGVMISYYLKAMSGGHVTAVDYSEQMIRVARSKYPESERLEYRVQDIYAMKDESCYDRVVCFSCFPHFPDPVGAIAVLSRALRPGGLLCIAHSASRDHINGVHRESGELISNDYLPPVGIMGELLTQSGLDVEMLRDDNEYYIALARKRAYRAGLYFCRTDNDIFNRFFSVTCFLEQ